MKKNYGIFDSLCCYHDEKKKRFKRHSQFLSDGNFHHNQKKYHTLLIPKNFSFSPIEQHLNRSIRESKKKICYVEHFFL